MLLCCCWWLKIIVKILHHLSACNGWHLMWELSVQLKWARHMCHFVRKDKRLDNKQDITRQGIHKKSKKNKYITKIYFIVFVLDTSYTSSCITWRPLNVYQIHGKIWKHHRTHKNFKNIIWPSFAHSISISMKNWKRSALSFQFATFPRTFHFHYLQVTVNFKVQFLLTPSDW